MSRVIIFIALLMLLTSVGVFADQTCEHTDTKVLPDTEGTHLFVCNACDQVLYSASCYGGDSTCSARPVCVLCGEEYGIPPLPHIKGEGLSFNDECHFIACVNCDGPYPGTEEEHYFTNWYTVVSATDTADGKRERECFDCGYVQSVSIPTLEPKESNATAIIIALAVVILVCTALIVLYKKGMLKRVFSKIKK